MPGAAGVTRPFESIIGDGRHRIPFDSIVEATKRTGHDLPAIYRETAEGGLALLVE